MIREIGLPIDSAQRWIDRSRIHWNEGNVEEALRCCREALSLDPSNADALVNTGTLLWVEGDIDQAERLYREAHAIEPRHIGVILSIAALHHDAGDLEASLAWVGKAEAIRPHEPDVLWRRAMIELAMGDYEHGWAHYEAGLGHEGIRGRGPGFRMPSWNGDPCKRLLLWHEQGLGDTLQFVRYAKLCRERADTVVVLCPAQLTAVLKSCPFVDDAVESIVDGGFDRQISIMSLPHLFRTSVDTIPRPIPYLFADAVKAARWGSRMRSDRMKVGLVWAGNFRTKQLRSRVIDGRRSVPLHGLDAWLDIPNVDFFSLQKGEAGQEARGRPIVDFMDEVNDLADTAAIVRNLDLVVSVDTSVVHLAGAMGKPVWVLSRLDACWRWLRNRAESPWYPTARVFGQTTRGDWTSVIDTVGNELARVATSRTYS